METVRVAIANPKLNWVVKVHPVNVWRSRMDGAAMVQLEARTLERHFGSLPDHVRLMDADTGISTFSLFKAIHYGLTVRGTIGLELPCFGIPVVTAGTGRYSGRGFTLDSSTQKSYRDLLAKLQDVPLLSGDAVRLARLHYHATFDLMPFPMRSFSLDFNAIRRPGLPPLPDVSIHRRIDESLLDAEDIGRLVHWLSEAKDQELLSRTINTAPEAMISIPA